VARERAERPAEAMEMVRSTEAAAEAAAIAGVMIR
jgi:hypothetical protein